MADRAEAAVRGAAGAPVTAAEVRRLVLAASSAWRTQRDLGLTEDGFDVWRKGALWDAVGKASFRALGQREFGLALEAFLKLGGKAVRTAAGSRPAGKWGRTNEAIAAREAGPEGDRRRAEWKLREECREAGGAFGGEGGALAYAEGLLARIHRTTLAAATARQVWQALFTLRARAAKKRRAAETAPGAVLSGGPARGSLG